MFILLCNKIRCVDSAGYRRRFAEVAKDGSPQIFQDPLHLQIRFDPTDSKSEQMLPAARSSSILQKIIDTQEFQRLRYIRQNGLANLVFHGAEHSRFTHSLGVMHVARTMFERISRNMSEIEDDSVKLLVQVAALIHDVGHGPFSHTMEEILKDNKIPFHHETMTKRFIVEGDSEINKILREHDPKLPELLIPFFDNNIRTEEHWKFRLVSSQMDADRLDYVQRDALFAGLRGHGFDIERVLDLLYHHENSIAVDRGAIEAVESYLVTIDQLYRAIYYHHAVRAATQMLMSVFSRAVKLHLGGDFTVFPAVGGRTHPMASLLADGERVDLSTYLRLTDFSLWSRVEDWQFHPDKILSDLSKRVMKRNLLKTIPFDISKYKDSQSLIDRAKARIAELYGTEALDYYLMVDEPSRTSYKSYNWRPDTPVDSIWLIGGGGKPIPLEDEDENEVVRAFKVKKYFRRLILPGEVRDVLQPH